MPTAPVAPTTATCGLRFIKELRLYYEKRRSQRGLKLDYQLDFVEGRGVSRSQPGGLVESSRWSFGARGDDHRNTVRAAMHPGRGARTASKLLAIELPNWPLKISPFLSPLRGAGQLPRCFRWSFPPWPRTTTGYFLSTLRVGRRSGH